MRRSLLLLSLAGCARVTAVVGDDTDLQEIDTDGRTTDTEDDADGGLNCVEPVLITRHAVKDPIDTGPFDETGDTAEDSDTAVDETPIGTCRAVPGTLDQIREEPVHCLVLAPADDGAIEVWAVGLSTGRVAQVGAYGSDLWYGASRTAGMGRLGDHLLFQAFSSPGTRLDLNLATGLVTEGATGAPGGPGTTVANGRVYELGSFNQSATYDSVAAYLAGTASGTFLTDPLTATRLAIAGQEVYGLWHSTDVIVVADLATGEKVSEVPLEGWNTWVWGVSAFDGKLAVLDDGRSHQMNRGVRLSTYDPVSGTRLGTVFLPSFRATEPFDPALDGLDTMSGLWCESGDDTPAPGPAGDVVGAPL